MNVIDDKSRKTSSLFFSKNIKLSNFLTIPSFLLIKPDNINRSLHNHSTNYSSTDNCQLILNTNKTYLRYFLLALKASQTAFIIKKGGYLRKETPWFRFLVLKFILIRLYTSNLTSISYWLRSKIWMVPLSLLQASQRDLISNASE
jgi:hypothetical protein